MSEQSQLYDLIKHLSEKKIRIWLEQDVLKFKAPKGALDTELKNRMVQNKEGLITFLKEQKKTEEKISTRPDSNSLPVSHAQRRLWFIDQYSEASQKSAYNIPVALELKGNLNIEALEKSINALVEKHEVLQCYFVNVNGLAKQKKVTDSAISLSFKDLSKLSDEEKEVQCQQLIDDNLSTVFDLQVWPLFKPELIRLDDTHHVFLATMHHIIADGWSMNIVVAEIAGFYQQILETGNTRFAALTHQYADYAYWQEQSLEQQEKQIEFWKHYLEDVPVLELPLDKKRNKHSHQPGKHAFAQIDAELYQQLNALAQKRGVTLFMLLMAVFNILLSRFSGQKDISVGVPLANRNRKEWEPLIGFFVNSLVLRNKLDGNPLFSELLAQVQTNTLAMYSNQDVPFDVLVDALVEQRESAFTPLFQVMFSLQNSSGESTLDLPGLEARSLSNSLEQARYEMTWNLQENNAGIAIDLEYRSDLFAPQTIELYLAYFKQLLSEVVHNPEQAVEDYALENREKTLQQQLAFNPPETAYPQETLLYTLFENIVEQSPTAIAISSNGDDLNDKAYKQNYKEVHQNAENIAACLYDKGVREGDKVVLAFPRSLQMIQAILAVLKLGACYVPLDPDYPNDRKQYILNDCAANLLVTSEALVPTLESFTDKGCSLLTLEVALENAYQSIPPTFESSNSGSLAACVFYTSGSTGTPKGVVVPHKAIVRLVKNTNYYPFSEDDVLGHISNVCFDASSLEIWGALLNAGRVHVISQNDLLSVNQFSEIIEQQSISLMFLSMGLFRIYAQEKPEMFAPMNALMIGGEAVDLNAAKRVLQCGKPPLRLLNGYGPTENATFTACYDIREVNDDLVSMPLGKAVAHSKVFICDEHGRLLPTGVPGELICAGDGVALGYLNQDALTQQSFVKGFVKDLADEKVYRSGDLARYSSNGNIVLSGRIDEQIKLRGFRIEPGEIENTLENIEAVRNACVTTKTNVNNEKYLVAYITLQDNAALASSQEAEIKGIKEQAREKLPAYMLPSYFELIKEIPVNANGKVNKRALPEPVWDAEAETYHAPQNDIETLLETIWCDLLALEKISRDENFFTMGGHSLLATRLVAKIQTHFEAGISVKDIFEHPTIEMLAKLLKESYVSSLSNTVIPKAEIKSSYPLSKAQERLWFMHQMNPESSAYGMPMAIRIKGQLDVSKLESALDKLVERQQSLRTRFVLEGDKPYQKIVDVKAAYTFKQYQCESEKALSLAIQHNEARHFDLENGPLFFAELHVLEEGNYVLLMNMHHIISDGWSMHILQQEIMALYENEGSLETLDIQYVDFSQWQQNVFDEETQDGHINFWRKELQGVAEILHLPADRQRPEQQSFQGNIYKHKLDADVQKRALEYCQQQGISTFILGISCYSILLAKYAQQDDFCIGIPVSGRENSQLQNLIGFFVNGIVIRADLRNKKSVNELLEQFRNKSLEAFKHQDLSADVLIDALGIKPNNKYQPLAQVAFSHQSIERQDKQSNDLNFEVLESQNHSAKYDLMFSLGDDGKQLELSCEYATDIFDRESIQLLCSNFEALLSEMLAHPQKSVEQLTWYSHDELLERAGEQYQKLLSLSSNQQAIYIDSTINPDTRQNSIANILEINHELDVTVWEQAFLAIQKQHDIFRTDFINIDMPGHHKVYQAVLKVPKEGVFSYLDWSEKNLGFDAAVEELEQEAYCPYDLEKNRLFHYSVYKLGDSHYVAMLRAHHIIFDGVSGKVFLEEMAKCYQTLTNEGSEASLDACFVDDHFEDFIERKHQLEDRSELIDFWKKQSSHLEAVSFYRPDEEREADKNETHTQKQIEIDVETSKAIKKYCRENGVTPSIFFKCIYSLLIREYCRTESDFYLLEYGHGRTASSLNSYGVFYQQLPFIIDRHVFEGENAQVEHFKSLLLYAKDFQKQTRHVRDFSIQAQRSMLPIGNIGFMYNYTQFESHLNVLDREEKSLFLSPRAEGQVQLFVRERPQDYQLLLLFDDRNFQDYRLLERLFILSKSVLSGANANTSIGIRDCLLETDRDSFRQINNAFSQESIAQQHLLQLFSERAKKEVSLDQQSTALLINSDQTAVHDFSYAKLDRESSAVARVLVHTLKTEGDVNDAPVGLYFPENHEFFIALFAVLKAGFSYVPLSKKLPCERIEHIIESGQIRYVLSNAGLMPNLQNIDVEMLNLDSLIHKAQMHEAQETDVNFPDTSEEVKHNSLVFNPENCIYSVFTSGSTGLPKGAMVSHQSENNLLSWYENLLAINEHHRALIISDFGFDLTQKNFFAFLRHGAQVVLNDNEIFDPAAILDLIEKSQVTHINCAPSAFYALIAEGETAWKQLRSLRCLVLGGEAIVISELQNWYHSEYCQARIINSYGPTECTDVVCFYELGEEDFSGNRSVPLGRAIPNAELYVLNQNRGCAVPGIVGEIAISGACLGLGYIGQAKLNQEKFIDIETPFGSKRAYLTGDLGRISRAGQLEYIGRKDFQVKIRGQRIELGEIEQGLRTITGVRDALVTVFTPESEQDKCLIAYVLTNSKTFGAEGARRELAKVLPAYMVPQKIISLPDWPLNANGKVDRKALPAPDFFRQTEIVHPRNDTEKVLAEIWSEILGIQEVGVYDSFFELGGHSLLATKAVARVKEHFGVEFPLKALFDLHTISQIAEYIDGLVWAIESREKQGQSDTDEKRDEGFL